MRSLKTRLLVSFSVLIVFVFLFFGFFLYLGMNRILIKKVDEVLFDKARYLSSLIRVEGGKISFSLSDMDVGEFMNPSSNTQFILRLNTGEIIYKSFFLEGETFPLRNIPEGEGITYFTLKNKREEKRIINYYFLKEDELFKDLSFFMPSKKYGFILQVGKNLKLEGDIIEKFIFYLITLAFLTIFFSSLVIEKLIETSLSSIDKISHKVKLISDENLSERIDPERVDTELRGLAITINETFDRLKMAFERQKEFISYISHELRTPVSGIKLVTDVALRKKREVKDYIRYLKDIQKSANHLTRLINSILILSRIDMGKDYIRMEELSLIEVIDEAVHIVTPIAREKGVTIDSSVPEFKFIGNRDAFLEIFVNILENAIKYNKSGGWVKIYIKDPYSVVVEDNGIGISEKDLPHIFERFYRSESSRSRKTGGTGLGLSIAYELIKRQRGDIKIESKKEEGTKVIIVLPH